jgi:hypothetical protein
MHQGVVCLFGLCVVAFLFLYNHGLLHLLFCVPLLVVLFEPLVLCYLFCSSLYKLEQLTVNTYIMYVMCKRFIKKTLNYGR